MLIFIVEKKKFTQIVWHFDTNEFWKK